MSAGRAVVAGLAIVAATTAGSGTAGADAPSAHRVKLADQARALGITRTGSRYRFHEMQATAAEGRLVVEVPAPWSKIADSRLRRPATGERYGVGFRATTNLAKFRATFDVPGVRVTATTDVPTAPDLASLVRANAVAGCHAIGVRAFDNGVYAGSYELFDRCGRKKAAAVVVAALDARRSVLLAVAGQALTKADLGALDRALATASLEKPSA